MIWMYTVQGKEFNATDVISINQVMSVAHTQWVWVDIYNPTKEESEIISALLGNEPDIVEKIKERTLNPLNINVKDCVLCDYEKVNDYVLVTIPSISMKEQLQMYPIVLAKKKNVLITWGEEDGHSHSKLIKLMIRKLRELVEYGENLNSSLAIGMLLREIAVATSDVLLSIREEVNHLEERALENEEKHAVHSVFSLKKKITALYRIMVDEKKFMLDVNKKIIPRIKLDEKAKPILDDAIGIIDRGLDFTDSCNRTLDNLLTLQDLASIHNVEASINYLTIVLVIGTAILIILELLGKFGIH